MRDSPPIKNHVLCQNVISMIGSFGSLKDDGCPLVIKIFLLTLCSRCEHANKYCLVDQYVSRDLDLRKIKTLKIMSKSTVLEAIRKRIPS